MPDLSVLIPARQEEWLRRTIEDVLAHARADTEVITVLDGAWAEPPLPQHPKVTVVYQPVSIGQRAATNLAARLSDARYLMKLDAHCSVDEGFDVKLIEAAQELGEDVTQIPAQFNFHIFDWMCDVCGTRTYQAPPMTQCGQCGGPVHKEVVWQPRARRKTVSWRLDTDLHFQYWGQGEQRHEGDICDVMTSLGACFFMTRARFWQLGGLDEAHGSWGQFGAEIGLKSWLSGGRHVVNKRTWFAHFFRVGGIGFPYPIRASDQERARQYSRKMWMENAWPGQTRPLSWVIEKFAPLPGWHDPEGAEKLAQVQRAAEAFHQKAPQAAQVASSEAPSVDPELDIVPSDGAPSIRVAPRLGIVYYTDNRLDPVLADACRRQLRRAANGTPIACVSLAPLDFGDVRIVLDQPRGYLTMFQQQLAGLEALADVDTVFFCEHDCLYAPEHFAYVPTRPDIYAYNQAVWKVDQATGRALYYHCNQTSGLVAARELLLQHYRARVARVQAEGFTRRMGFEPGTHRRPRGIDDYGFEVYRAARPNVDIRHGTNLTPSRWSKEQFRDQRYTAGWTEAEEVPGWGRTFGRFDAWLREVTP